MLNGQNLVWAISLLVVAAIVLPYVWRFHRRTVVDRERKKEASRLGIDRPRAQYPWIDPTHCVGCAACVQACPEGDVLGVVGGTAVVINGLRCVGHSACEEVCPVGAITVGLGDLRSRKDMPLLDDSLETSVPGVYIVGELGGLSLVKNAIVQGRQVIEGIVERAGPEHSSEILDVAIVGAGPSGLSAALSAKAAGLSYRVIEKEADLGGSLLHYPRRKMVLTQPVELPPWGKLDRDEYAKETLLEIFTGILESFGLEILFGHPVSGVERRDDGIFEIEAGGETVRARHVVLALGRRGSPRKLGVPGEELSKVMYRLIDAESYNDERILVVGGGDSAIEAAVALACQPGNQVTLSYRKEKLVRIKRKNQDKIEPLLESGRVRPAMPSQVVSIAPDSVMLTSGDETSPEEIANDYVFVFAGGVPPFGFLQQIGVQFGGEG